jgi:putative NIF3 family GTP cyclohydrolase 1 type 2
VKLSHFYRQVVKFGAEFDPRKNKKIKSFEDTAILYGNPNTEVKKILVGIDIEAPEVLLADRIRQREGLDLVVAHHPEGRPWVSLYKVMQLQVDLLIAAGIKQEVAQQLVEERKREVERRVLPNNHMRTVDAARLLDIPLICMHTPADNHVSNFLQKLFNKEKPKQVKDIIDLLMGVPEYKRAAKETAGPSVILGSPRRPAGKIFLEMTGGTEGSKEVFGKLYKVGVRTLVCMHVSEEHLKKVKDANLNVIIAGHISSDNLGLNLLLDRIEKEEKFETIECSGFYRIRRNAKPHTR